MKVVIIYCSKHHKNTKKLLDSIEDENLTLIEAKNDLQIDLNKYDIIGFASGIYYQNFDELIIYNLEKFLPQNKDVFFIYTCGIKRNIYTNKIIKLAKSRNSNILGIYSSRGYDTFGPFKFIGGIAKNHPNSKDISGVIDFYKNILVMYNEKLK